MYKITAYASSANLGPGFDILGMCLDLKNTFIIEPADHFEYEGFDPEFANEDNLFVRSYKQALTIHKHPLQPLKISIESEIPVSRGLGSSSSLIVGGVLAANAIMGSTMTKEEMLKIATQIEGHPDNVAPCLYGGVCASGLIDDDVFFKTFEVSDDLKFIFLSPDFELSTEKARQVLPKTTAHKDAVNNSLSILMLLEGLKNGDESLINSGIADKMHVPYRKMLIREYNDVEAILLKSGAIGVTISGAGPTIMAIVKKIDIAKLKEELSGLNNSWTVYELNIEKGGSYCEQISDR